MHDLSKLAHPDSAIQGEKVPGLDEIAAQHMALAPWVNRTPVFDKTDLVSLEHTTVNFKFELLQASGSFKVRGAFSNLLALNEIQRNAGEPVSAPAIMRLPWRMRRCAWGSMRKS